MIDRVRAFILISISEIGLGRGCANNLFHVPNTYIYLEILLRIVFYSTCSLVRSSVFFLQDNVSEQKKCLSFQQIFCVYKSLKYSPQISRFPKIITEFSETVFCCFFIVAAVVLHNCSFVSKYILRLVKKKSGNGIGNAGYAAFGNSRDESKLVKAISKFRRSAHRRVQWRRGAAWRCIARACIARQR